MVLVMSFHVAGIDVERYHRRGVEIITRTGVAHPWTSVAGAPIGEIELGVE